MAMIEIKNLVFGYDNSYENVFDDISFKIDTDWKLGIIARNGRGKTTFLKILMGKLEYSGSITSNIEFDYFPFVINDKNTDTLEVINKINNDYELWQLKRELSLLKVNDEVLYRPFDNLSEGEQVKVLLATLFLKENKYLLIDEPTNHLDIMGREIVSNYLKCKNNFILVSHDRDFIDNCVDHVLVINKDNIEIQSGNFTSWYTNKQNQDNLELQMNRKLKKDIEHLAKASKRTASWSNKVEQSKNGVRGSGVKPPDKGFIGHKSAKMMKRAKSIEKRQVEAIENKSELLKNIEIMDQLKIQGLKYPKQLLVMFNNVSIFYDDHMVTKDISFDIRQGDKIVLQGSNGSGKSSILKLIKGEKTDYKGEFRKGKDLIINYVSQDTSFLKGDLGSYANTYNIDITMLKTILRKLDFSHSQFEKKREDYSSGQKKKVLIAASLSSQAHLYVFDEPLNYIDVFSRIQIEDLLSNSDATIIFVEHDKRFSELVTNKIIKV